MGAKIKIGETATSTLDVDIEYVCSFCDTENLCTETLTGSSYTPTVAGINLDKDIKLNATVEVFGAFYELTNPKNPDRFNNANLSCSCRRCKKQEPWARMDYSFLDRVYFFCLFVSVAAGFIFLTSGGLVSIEGLPLYLLIICVVTACICVGISRYKTVHTKKMVALIKELPLKSMPRISFYSRDRHDDFYRRHYL